jgi:hydrogenase large subunit
MANSDALIKNIHRRYKDSTYARVIARIYEMIKLTLHAKELMLSLDVTTPSFIKPKDISKLSSTGIGVIEAPRGVLIHKIKLQKGKISSYEIITPTQFNLSSGDKTMLSPSQNAMIGLDEEEASFVFRSFDVCSVCTTH